jgi:serine/threonine protein phosphatase 1
LSWVEVMRTIAVGDIHGCYLELQQLLAKVQLTSEDRLVAVGDIVDRGADSVRVYDFLRQRPNTIVIMGNHEHKHLHQKLSYSQEIVKLQFGDRYPEFLDWVQHLPYVYETEEAILVHAGVEDGVAIEAQRPEVLCGCVRAEQYLERRYGKPYWCHVYTGEKPVIFGHHLTGDRPFILHQKLYGIDTGACHGGRLTAMILPSFEVVQVKAQRDYWREESLKWELPVMKSKPWSTYKWQKIKGLCADFRNSTDRELLAFVAQQEQWVNDLYSLAPIAIAKLEEKSASATLAVSAEQRTEDGADDFARHLSYTPLLAGGNSNPLTPELLQQALPTPKQWIQVMTDLEIYP